MMNDLTCQRCKQPLVNDVAIPGDEGRLVCSRHGCQYVEAMIRAHEDGSDVLVDSEQYVCEIVPPGVDPLEDFKRREVAVSLTFDAVLIRPLPEAGEPNEPSEPKRAVLEPCVAPESVDWPFCPHEFVICRQPKRGDQPYCECCKSWLGPPPAEHKRCGGCR